MYIKNKNTDWILKVAAQVDADDQAKKKGPEEVKVLEEMSKEEDPFHGQLAVDITKQYIPYQAGMIKPGDAEKLKDAGFFWANDQLFHPAHWRVGNLDDKYPIMSADGVIVAISPEAIAWGKALHLF